jgi:curved DNA-binding protein
MDRRRALALLGLKVESDAATLRAAFRQAVKATHPDRVGGDAARLRLVIEAYGLLKLERPGPPSTPARTATVATPSILHLHLSPALAASGGEAIAALPGDRQIRVAVPAGLRNGDRVRAGEVTLTVKVVAEADLTLRGDDLWLTATLPCDAPRGGRLGVATPSGPRDIWIGRRALSRGLVRLTGEGLPARGPHAAGDMFVRLRTASRPESGARSRLRAFQAAWMTPAL